MPRPTEFRTSKHSEINNEAGAEPRPESRVEFQRAGARQRDRLRSRRDRERVESYLAYTFKICFIRDDMNFFPQPCLSLIRLIFEVNLVRRRTKKCKQWPQIL